MQTKNSRGLLIAVFGPDGSGKSTIYQNLKRECNKRNIKVTNQHWRPGFLPYKKMRIKDQKLFESPHLKKQRNMIISLGLVFYIFADFILGYYFVLRPQLKTGINIYYERYFYDLLIDQLRYRLNVPVILSNLLSRFIIKPDKIIILDAPSNIIYERKQELTIEEITRQRKSIHLIFGKKRNVYKMDVFSKNAESCGLEICALLNKQDE